MNFLTHSLTSGCKIYFCGGYVFFFGEVARIFLLRGCMIFLLRGCMIFLLRRCMIFVVERLHDFCC